VRLVSLQVPPAPWRATSRVEDDSPAAKTSAPGAPSRAPVQTLLAPARSTISTSKPKGVSAKAEFVPRALELSSSAARM
jgi:hypothetical protein